MIKNLKFNVELVRKKSATEPLTLVQYDRGYFVTVYLYEDGQPYIIEENERIQIDFALPHENGYIISKDSIYNIEGNHFDFKVNRNITLYSGKGTMNVALVDKDTGITLKKNSNKYYIDIMGNSLSEDFISKELIVSAKEELDEKITEAGEVADTLQQAIKTGDLDNKAEKTYVDEKVNTINTNIKNINSSLNNYVTKVAGKGLSTNDFTNAYKTILDGLTTTINNAILESKKALHPVNSIYLSMNSTNPNTLFGFGTWQLIAQGRTLVGVDTSDNDFKTAGKTGGSKTHTLTVQELAPHTHAQKISAIFDDGTFSGRSDYNSDSNTMKAFGQGITTEETGGGQAFSIMQPYFCVYIFKRTA